jgi:hypothetical protein
LDIEAGQEIAARKVGKAGGHAATRAGDTGSLKEFAASKAQCGVGAGAGVAGGERRGEA